VIDEAPVELTVVESVVGTARHVLDTAIGAERVTIQIAARLKTVVVVGAGVVVEAAYGVKSLLDRRRAGSPESAEALVDDAFTDDNG
jgi:hypothetical protein